MHSVGDYITIEWVVKWPYGFGLLEFIDNKDQKRILKSTVTNITHLTGSTTIQWTLTEYNGEVPVVNVSQYQSSWVPSLPQYRYDPVNGVVFRPWYDVSITVTWDLISITDPVVNKEVIKIRSFVCDGISNTDECGMDWADLPGFVSSYRHKFIQWDGVWYVFGDGVWYRIRASDEYYINTMSQYFDLMNTRLMADLIRGQLASKCVGPRTDVAEYVSHTLREQNGNSFIIVRWLNSQQKLAVCQLKLITDNNTFMFEGITTIPVEE